MFEVNGTLVIFVASFLIFIKLLDEVLLKPVGRVLEAREAKVKSDLEAAGQARKSAQSLVDEYQSKLHSVRSQAQGVINEAVEKANYHRNLEIGKVRDEGLKKVEEAKAALAVERSALMEGLVQQEVEMVGAITGKLLDEKVTVSLDPAAVRRALEEASA
jgi:F-type H+-transporting ATPase subunit b